MDYIITDILLIFALLVFSIILTIVDIKFIPKTLYGNIIKRIAYITFGFFTFNKLFPEFIIINISHILWGILIGSIFMILHLIIAKGIKLRIRDIDKGFIKTCLLIYLIELPAEEFLYRGLFLVPLMIFINPYIAILISSLLFLSLHIKTWNDKFVWIGSFTLALVCAFTVYHFQSIWVAIIIHNLNDFGFLTLVNKRNIFIKS